MLTKRFTLKDCCNAANLHQAVFYKGWKEEDFLDLLQNPLTKGLKVEENQELTGYILWRMVGDEAEVLTLVINPLHQRKGKGTLLLKALLKYLVKAKIRHLYLEVAEDNREAYNFYINKGFLVLSKRLNYYPRAQGKFVSALNLYKKLL